MSGKIQTYPLMRRLPQGTVYARTDSPVGELTLIASNSGLHALVWDNDHLSEEFAAAISQLTLSFNHPVISEACQQLREYFAGLRTSFDLPLCLDGTDFQMKAWRELIRIPYGKTISYQEQAIALGDKNKVRAIGGANGRNPISIIVPCHRVIAKNGKLQGFGGGLEIKQFLLKHENPELF